MKKFLTLLLVLVLAIGLVACGKPAETTTPPTEGGETTTNETTEPLSILLIVGSLGDNSFNDAANLGVVRCKDELGATTEVQEYGSDKSKLPNYLLDAIDAGKYDFIIVGNDTEGNKVIAENAGDHPEIFFFIYDSFGDYPEGLANVQAVTFKANESDYLVAAIAAQMSKTGVIGFMGGDENDGINDFLVGYMEGCVKGNAEARVAYNFIAEGNASWSNPAKGKELAKVLYESYKADFLHGVAGQSGDGVFEAVVEYRKAGADVWAIGVDQDQYTKFAALGKQETADVIITSALKVLGGPIFKIAQQLIAGEAPESGLVAYGVKEGASGYADNDYYKANVPAEVQAFAADLYQQIADGKITVSTAYGMSDETMNALKAATVIK